VLGFEHALRNDDDHADERIATPLADDQVPQHVRSWCPVVWMGTDDASLVRRMVTRPAAARR
jgi:hypothetical protein